MNDVHLFHGAIGITKDGRRVRIDQNPTDNCYGYYAMSPPGWCCYYFKDGRPGLGGSHNDRIVEVINPEYSPMKMVSQWMECRGRYPGDDVIVAEMMGRAVRWWIARDDQIDAITRMRVDEIRDLCEAMLSVS